MREYQRALHNTEVFFDMNGKDGRDSQMQTQIEPKEQKAK